MKLLKMIPILRIPVKEGGGFVALRTVFESQHHREPLCGTGYTGTVVKGKEMDDASGFLNHIVYFSRGWGN